jgi:hypothetical protein
MSKPSSAVAALVMAVAVAACAERTRRWEDPPISQRAWEVDRTECQQLASQQAEREFRLVERDIGDLVGRPTVYGQPIHRFDAARRRDEMFDRCMRDRAYESAIPAEEPKAKAKPAPASAR